MNDFLKCNPIVFVIENYYEILVITNENGLIYIDVGGKIYHEKNSGVLHTEKNVEKIKIPQSALDNAGCYRVCFRKSVDKKDYFSILGDLESEDFAFSPIGKDDEIKAYHIADIHGNYKEAKKCISFYRDKLNLLIFNGDIIEAMSIENYYETCKFIGSVSEGRIPVIFSRGNHDTRGKMAEDCDLFFPEKDGRFYYTFSIGSIHGIVLDCGEDKPDSHIVYGGTNDFEGMRRDELEFLRGLSAKNDKKWNFAISHIAPSYTAIKKGSEFDIEREIYSLWNGELERLGIKFMLTGHIHRFDFIESGDEKSTTPHNYPIFVASYYDENVIGGAYVVFKECYVEVKYTNSKGQVVACYKIDMD